jgi:hypothetical protein
MYNVASPLLIHNFDASQLYGGANLREDHLREDVDLVSVGCSPRERTGHSTVAAILADLPAAVASQQHAEERHSIQHLVLAETGRDQADLLH